MACPTILPKAKHTATVIFLHGLGDTGHGWLAGLEDIALPYVKYMCPNAPIQKVTLNAGMQMPSWFDIKSLSFNAEEDEAGIKKSSDNLKKLILDEEESGIPSNRIVIGGFSQGGAVALHSLITYDNKLAAYIGLSTFMPLHSKFNDIRRAENLDTPILLGHGNADPVVNYDFGVMTNHALKQYYKNTKFNTYRGLGHSSHPQEMKDVQSFLSKVLQKTE